jgi:hypothetical protein
MTEIERIDTRKYIRLEELARDLYDVYKERTSWKKRKILEILFEIKKEAEQLLLDAKTTFEQQSLNSIIISCNAVKDILNNQKKNRKTRELLEIHTEDILVQAMRLTGKTGEIDPGYDPTEYFIPDMPEYEPPSILEDAGDFYDV